MNILHSIFFIICLSLLADEKDSLYSQQMSDTKGNVNTLAEYKGKTILFVNIATRCGYTPQLDSLEKLYQKYRKDGFVIIGLPSNDFGSQTPEQGDEIAKFCKLRYGVTFPLSKRIEVSGSKKDSLMKYLLAKFDGQEIAWNFEKFLFDKNGKPVSRFSSSEAPLDSSLEKAIIKSLQ